MATLLRKSFLTLIYHVGIAYVLFYRFQISYLGHWYIWSYFLYNVMNTCLISFFYMWASCFPSIFCWRYCLFWSVYFEHVCQLLEGCSYMYSCLDLLFGSSGLHSFFFFGSAQTVYSSYGSVVHRGIWNGNASSISLFAQECVGYLGSLWFHVNFRVVFFLFL